MSQGTKGFSRVASSPTLKPVHAANAVKCGYLRKRGFRPNSWKTKYFVLPQTQKEQQLYYFDNEGFWLQKQRPSSSITLSDPVRTLIIDSANLQSSPSAFCFSIYTPDKILHLSAQSEEEHQEWINAISCAVFSSEKNATRVLLDEEILLQEIQYCTVSCTGKFLPLWDKKFAEQALSSIHATVSAGIRLRAREPEFMQSSRSKVATALGQQEISTKLSSKSLTLEASLISEGYSYRPLKVLLWVTSYRLLIRYNKRSNPHLKNQNQHQQEGDGISYISIPIDSICKISSSTVNKDRNPNVARAERLADKYFRPPNKAPLIPLTNFHSVTVECKDFRQIQIGFDCGQNPDHLISVNNFIRVLKHKLRARCHSVSFLCKQLANPSKIQSLGSKKSLRLGDLGINSPTRFSTVNVPIPEPVDLLSDQSNGFSGFIFDEKREFSRFKLHESSWKFSCVLSTKLNEGQNRQNILFFKRLIVPSINESTVSEASKLRNAGLFPNLVWKHPDSELYLFSCFQRVTIQTNSSGIYFLGPVEPVPVTPRSRFRAMRTSSTNSIPQSVLADQSMLKAIALETSRAGPIRFYNIIHDPHNYDFAFEDLSFTLATSSLKDLSWSTQNILLPPHSRIHRSYTALYSLCSYKINPIIHSPEDIFEFLIETNWMQFNLQFLKHVIEICSNNSGSIILQSHPDEWYSIVIVQSLIQLILDPYYRTISGFCVLLQKEWFSLRHFPLERTSHTAIKEMLYIPFIQFLDITWQLTQVFPSQFEFNDRLLMFLAESLHCGTLFFRLSVFCGIQYQEGFNIHSHARKSTEKDFGPPSAAHPFIEGETSIDSKRGSQILNLHEQTERNNVWLLIGYYNSHFLNPVYKATLGALQFTTTLDLSCWMPYYLRYSQWQSILRSYSELQSARIGRMANVSVDLSGMGLADIPLEYKSLVNLREVNVSYNFLTAVPKCLCLLPSLSILSLEGNYISLLFPDKLIPSTTLTVLNLNFNRISSLPADLVQLSNLEELYLSGNNIYQIPSFLTQLSNLRVLDMSYNQLTELPKLIGEMSSLRGLFVNNNQIKKLPVSLGSLPHLESLNLASNLLENTKSIESIKSGCQEISRLNISYNVKFDTSFYFRMTSLTEVYLRGLSLHQLPSNITSLTSLIILDLKENQFSEFPLEILALSSLQVLNLSFNQLRSLPLDLKKLGNLKRLLLRSNQLHIIDFYAIGAIESLEVLDLYGNISINSSGDLVANIHRCSLLKQLRLSSKKWISGGALSDFFSTQQQLSESKLPFCYLPPIMVMGPESVGKTTFIRWFTNRWEQDASGSIAAKKSLQFEFIAPTEGVEIKSGFAFFPQKTFISVWDFSGDKRYFSMQQNFIRPGVFLVFFSWQFIVTHSLDVVKDWLNMLYSFTQSSSLIVVATHADQMTHQELSQAYVQKQKYFQQLQQSFPTLLNFFLLSTAPKVLAKSSVKFVPHKSDERDSITQKKAPLISHLYELERVILGLIQNAQVPFGFADFYFIVDNLRSSRQIPTVTLDELLEAAELCKIKIDVVEEFRTLLSQCGVILDVSHKSQNDQTHSEEEVNKPVLYSPQWLAELFTTLYPSDLANYRLPPGGILTNGAIEQCWRPPKFPGNIHQTLLRILHDLDYLAIVQESQQNCRFSLGRRGVSSFAEHQAIAFVPTNFTGMKPIGLLSEILEPLKFHSNSMFHFEYLPLTYYPKVVVEIFRVATPVLIWSNGLMCQVGQDYALMELVSVVQVKQLIKEGSWTENWAPPELFDDGHIMRIGMYLLHSIDFDAEDVHHETSSAELFNCVVSCLQKIVTRWYPSMSMLELLN